MGDGHSGVETPIATVPLVSDWYRLVDALDVGSRLGGDTATGHDLTPHSRLNNLLRQNTWPGLVLISIRGLLSSESVLLLCRF